MIRNISRHRRRTVSTARVERGASLIEVLVAVLIMAIGLLGIAAMQTAALRNNQSALERSQAVIQTYAILDAMRANRDQALAGAYNMGALTCAVPAAVGTLAQNDVNAWMQSIHDTLGTDACGQVTCPANSPCQVTVRWNDIRATDGGITGQAAGNRSITTMALL
ncbi:type IV pilus modification protein PilV [Luteimonas sp. MC1782]|nr:type IV pilus modification protein PilV [Luteimonas sp. MC1895]MBJ6983685.1 type IV pilus modification protein PilV [Luteimonas sp. MC1750]QQO07191.1 type IV pilus modification protein PilV [Luteimonas sp. MC1750]